VRVTCIVAIAYAIGAIEDRTDKGNLMSGESLPYLMYQSDFIHISFSFISYFIHTDMQLRGLAGRRPLATRTRWSRGPQRTTTTTAELVPLTAQVPGTPSPPRGLATWSPQHHGPHAMNQ
jgi:hypothetical protein